MGAIKKQRPPPPFWGNGELLLFGLFLSLYSIGRIIVACAILVYLVSVLLKPKSFLLVHLHNRSLMLKMLRYEDSILMGEKGQQIYRSHKGTQTQHLKAEYAIARMTLRKFGFSDDKQSTLNYRRAITVYYRGPTDYDKEVMSSVVYLRANRLLYYTTPKIKKGQTAPDVKTMFHLDGKRFSLYSYLNGVCNRYKKVLVCAFSAS